MSKKVGAHITCPHCNHKFDMELYCSIWGEYKENKELVLSDKINVAHCPRCNKETKLEFSLLYTNTPKKIAVWWEPKFDPQVEADAQGYKKLLPSSHLANAPRIRSWEEFKKKIIELEKNSEQQEAQYKSKTCSSKEDLIDIKLTATALFFLLLSLVDYRFPYGFYELLRFIVCGYCCYYAYLIYKKSKIQFRFIISLIFALIYNPFVKMSFEREEGFLINIMTAVAIVFFERTSLLSLISRKGYTPNNKLNASTVLSKEEFEKLFISYVNERKNNKNIPYPSKKDSLHMIDRPQESQIFLKARNVMGKHIQKKMHEQGGFNAGFSWLRSELTSPSFDDMTFSYKNKVFSLLIELRKNGKNILPEHRKKIFQEVCDKNDLLPCIFPIDIETLKPIKENGWNLSHLATNKSINPTTIATNKKTKMSDWEFNNFAIFQVRQFLKEKGYKIHSFCDAPDITPQIWFEDKDGKMAWIIVKYGLYPTKAQNIVINNIEQLTSTLPEYNGYIAKLSFKPQTSNGFYRKTGFIIEFTGLEKVYTA